MSEITSTQDKSFKTEEKETSYNLVETIMSNSGIKDKNQSVDTESFPGVIIAEAFGSTPEAPKRTLYGLEKNVFILFQRFFIYFSPLMKRGIRLICLSPLRMK